HTRFSRDWSSDVCSSDLLPRFDAVCKQQIKWWRGRGFPRYYEMKALEVFHQAVGRLIRSGTDTGVLALLDQRAMDSSQNVFKTRSEERRVGKECRNTCSP